MIFLDSAYLSEYEVKIIECLAMGLCSKQTAEAMGLKAPTVETYRTRLIHKVGCKNSNHLVSWAYQNQILKVLNP